MTAPDTALSEGGANPLDVGVDPCADDALLVLDEDVVDLCEMGVVSDVELTVTPLRDADFAVPEPVVKPPEGLATADFRTTCWVVLEVPDVDGAAAAGAATVMLIPAVANPIARSRRIGIAISLPSR